MGVEEKLNMILDWATCQPNFDISFVEDLHQKYQEDLELTANQEQALDNIIYRFNIS